ncbi:MAG TPA: Asd/ArgC dimerization domain-containing protein [Candidatus Acidoferrum sp.]|nr:Asd/ArgC dimerization domain-containing protein [Candidatus Acidoferrum sp.]
MPSFERDSQRIVIAGASSLLGAELKSLLEESKFAGWDLRLVDEEVAAGTLTEAGGEAAVIQPVEEGSFDRARIVFFAGSPEFVERNFKAALAAGAVVIDFTGMVRAKDCAPTAWFPKIDEFWGTQFKPGPHFWIISAPAVAASSLSLSLKPLGLKKLSISFLRPVSEAGRAGIEELESQTKQLLSFQNAGQTVFDAQVAFAVSDRFGAGSRENLSSYESRLREEVEWCVFTPDGVQPALRVLHAPVFYGYAFSANAELDASATAEQVIAACMAAGFALAEKGAVVSNLTCAGEHSIQLAQPEADPSQPGSWWFWGAVDNIRLPAWNAVKLAEKLVP